MRFVESCKVALDHRGHAGTLLVDLSNAFDGIDHELLIQKLLAYRLSRDALLRIYRYLVHRRQRVKVNRVFSPWKEAKAGVPQGSVLRPLFSTYL